METLKISVTKTTPLEIAIFPYMKGESAYYKHLGDGDFLRVSDHAIFAETGLSEWEIEGLTACSESEFHEAYQRIIEKTSALRVFGSRITFQQFLQTKGERLHPWQERAANAFLLEMQANREGPTGKSWLLRHLREFIEEHGNNFSVE